jgi:hypothetical protein
MGRCGWWVVGVRCRGLKRARGVKEYLRVQLRSIEVQMPRHFNLPHVLPAGLRRSAYQLLQVRSRAKRSPGQAISNLGLQGIALCSTDTYSKREDTQVLTISTGCMKVLFMVMVPTLYPSACPQNLLSPLLQNGIVVHPPLQVYLQGREVCLDTRQRPRPRPSISRRPAATAHRHATCPWLIVKPVYSARPILFGVNHEERTRSQLII